MKRAPRPDDGEPFAGELTFCDADEWKGELRSLGPHELLPELADIKFRAQQ
ncbi:MAG TPA: hypothetical protein VF343_06735 [Syntrophales bacterium]